MCRRRSGRAVAAVIAGSLMILGSVVTTGGTLAAGEDGSKVVVIVMENEPYSRIIGNPDASYINSLRKIGRLYTNYSAVAGGSLHDYLAMTSGLTSVGSPSQRNVFQATDDSGGTDTWTSFEESMGGNCGRPSAATVPGTTIRLYDQGHDPAYQLRRDESCKKNDIPMTTTSFNPAVLPSFSFIVPNTCDDMHTLPTGGRSCPAFFGPNKGSNNVQMGDDWLRVVVPRLLARLDVTVVLTWDEGTRNEHIATLEVGAGVPAASSSSSSYDDYNMESGLYKSLGLGQAPNHGRTVAPLPIP